MRYQQIAVSVIFALAAAAALAVMLLSSSSSFSASEDDPVALMQQKLDDYDDNERHHRSDGNHKHCDRECLAKRRRIADQMKALQRQINHDYKNMISFGHKAGYVPPVKSIRQQVMDGSLLSSGDDEAAPPPFDPNLRSSDDEERHRQARQHKDRPRSSAHHADHHSIVPSIDEGREHSKRKPSISHSVVTHREAPHLGHHIRFHSGGNSANSKWKKLFSFMDKKPHDERSAIKAPRPTIPSAVRRAIQRALSFATTPHKSKTERAGDQLLGLKESSSGGRHDSKRGKDPIQSSKFLRSYFGDGR